MAEQHIRIRGDKELAAAFLELRREVLKELRPTLVAAAEPVRKEAQQRAGAEISQIGDKWNRMRIGVTMKGVYVAPRSRRTIGPPRPNLAGLLMTKAMQPALDDKRAEVLAQVDLLVAASAHRTGF